MMKTFSRTLILTSILLAGSLTTTSMVSAQEMQANKQQLMDAYPGKAYSPYAKRTFPERPLWGDTHVHTMLSMDAGMFGNRLGPTDAYRLAKGEEVIASSGQPLRLARPLDWLVIADHSDGMGMSADIIQSSPNVTKYPDGKRWSEDVAKGG